MSNYSDQSRMQADHNVHMNSALHCRYDMVAAELHTHAHLPYFPLQVEGSLVSVRRGPFHSTRLRFCLP